VHDSFELSEASNTPVMLEVRIRACHVHGRFATRDNVRPTFPLSRALDAPSRDTNRIVLPPASFLHEKEKIEHRWPAAVEFIHARGMNETFDGDIDDIGIIMQGGMYNGVITALREAGLADIWGETRVPLYVMNVTYPLVDRELIRFAEGKRAILIVEEGQPEFLGQPSSRHAVRIEVMRVDEIRFEPGLHQAPKPFAHGPVKRVRREVHADLGNNHIARMIDHQAISDFAIRYLAQGPEVRQHRRRPGHRRQDVALHLAAGYQVTQPRFDEDAVRRLQGIGKQRGGCQDGYCGRRVWHMRESPVLILTKAGRHDDRSKPSGTMAI